jgi:hypothetical protein
MPDSVIKRVETIAARDKRSGNMVFSARDGTTIGDDHDDNDEDVTVGVYNDDDDDTGEERSQNNPPSIPLENQNGPSNDEINDEEAELIPTPEFTADTPETDEEEIPGVGEDEIPGVGEDEIPGVGEGDEESSPSTNTDDTDDGDDGVPSANASDDPDSSDDEDDDDIPRPQVYNPDTWTLSQKRIHGLLPRKERDYSHLHANIVHHAMMQYSLKKGFKKFPKKAEAAVTKELLQLHMKDTFTPMNGEKLTDVQRKAALESLMFLKEKRDGSIKGRACAGGRKQREGSIKSDATSPMVSLEAVLLTATIDAFEGRDVAIVDVPGAFLTADMDEVVYMCLRGKMCELMVKTAPEIYRKHVFIENNKHGLYVKLQKALYGCLRSALLFYLKLLGDLEANGFVLNPYDPCVANKMVNGKQFTITWHVDDLKLSHEDENEVTKIIKWLKEIYGEDMIVSRGKRMTTWGWISIS